MQYTIHKYTKQQMQEQFEEVYEEEAMTMLEHKCCGLDFTTVYTISAKHDNGEETCSGALIVVREGHKGTDVCIDGEILTDYGNVYLGAAFERVMTLAETEDAELFE